MPIYEYKCRQCKKTYELLQGITEAEATVCIYCGGPVGKLMSLSAFHLKGSGWYATDYAGKKPTCEAKKENKEEPCANTCQTGNCGS